jgi:hypothetical protein
MKSIIFILAAALCVQDSQAQTFAEWFHQTKTRIKYYEKQIAALQVYATDIEKGYRIAETGVKLIGAIKQGEFDLHNAYYGSLESINPQIGGMPETAEVISLQAAIVEKFSRSLASYRQDHWLSPTETGYVATVYSNLLKAGLADINTLTDLTSAGKLKMTDNERMAGIKALDAGMSDKWAFTLSFIARTDLLIRQRQAEQSDIGDIQNLW